MEGAAARPVTQHQVVVVAAAANAALGAEDVIHLHLALAVKGISRDGLVWEMGYKVAGNPAATQQQGHRSRDSRGHMLFRIWQLALCMMATSLHATATATRHS